MSDTAQPANLSLAHPNTFKFTLTRTPNLVYSLQRIDLPGMSISGTQVYPGPLAHTDFTVPGEKITYDPLTIGCLLDEDFVGWLEIVGWMRELINAPGAKPKRVPLKNMSDATILLNNNKFRSNMAAKIYNLYPTNIGPVSFDYSIGPDAPLVYDVTFNYSHYEVVSLKE